MKQLYYNSLPNVNFTDHKPVISYFQIEVQTNLIKKSGEKHKSAFIDFLTDEFKSLSMEKKKDL